MATNKINNIKGYLSKEVTYYKKRFWKVFFYSMGAIGVFFLFASWGLFGSMPSFEDLENPDSNLAT